MSTTIRAGDCVRIPDGRVGRVPTCIRQKYRVRVRRLSNATHQFLTFTAKDLKRIECPKGYRRPAGLSGVPDPLPTARS